MHRLMERIGERLLGHVLPTETASASTCCGGGCGYEYRCYNDAAQRRYCCTTCSCTGSCTGWTKIGGC
jgi:hypothetical protein